VPDRGLTDDQGRIIVCGDDVITVQVLWRNLGATSKAPRMQAGMRRTGLTASWVREGPWVQCDAVAPGAQGSCVLQTDKIPTDWGAGVTIDVRVNVEGVGIVWQQDDILVIGEEVPVNITGVSTYVVEE
jgi:hypothetical protein